MNAVTTNKNALNSVPIPNAATEAILCCRRFASKCESEGNFDGSAGSFGAVWSQRRSRLSLAVIFGAIVRSV